VGGSGGRVVNELCMWRASLHCSARAADTQSLTVLAAAAACPQAFAEVLAGNEAWTAPMDETYSLLGVDPASITTLDDYLQVRCCGSVCCPCLRGDGSCVHSLSSAVVGFG
jgi:predicted short-subunit dehydrogenase-like oxidoreductase (DUF2520 family)